MSLDRVWALRLCSVRLREIPECFETQAAVSYDPATTGFYAGGLRY